MKMLKGASLLCLCLTAFDALAQEKKKPLEVYGFAQADYIQDFYRVDPNWESTLRPSKIPTHKGEFGTNGQAHLSVRQTRFGVQGTLPVENNPLYTRFEIDLFGVGPDEGQTTIRLRHAYGEYKKWLAGQTHSLFMNIDVFPNSIDYWGPNGMVFLRNPQIRYTFMKGADEFAMAIEKPGNDIDPGSLRTVGEELGLEAQADEALPDVTSFYRMTRNWGHFQASGILRSIGYETLGNSSNTPKGQHVGWGVNLSTNIKFQEKDRLILATVYGKGIASYMNDGGTDLGATGRPGDAGGKVVPLLGLVAFYDHFWNEKYSTSLGYSRTEVTNTRLQEGDAFQKGEYALVNILHYPVKNIMMGGEVLWGARTDKDNNYGQDLRTQISFKYSFSSLDFI